jgi:hypothetical protein
MAFKVPKNEFVNGYRKLCLLRLIAAMPVAAMFGCGPTETHSGPTDDIGNLRGIARVYTMANRDLGRPPRNVDELKNILAPAMDNPESVFRSQRDGQEFVIVWGLDMVGRDLNSPTVLAYERTGVDGKRLVVNCAGNVTEVSEADFSKLRFPKGHKPSGA